MINGVIRGAGCLVTGITLCMMITFIILNVMTGCDSWDQPQCITLAEFASIFVGE